MLSELMNGLENADLVELGMQAQTIRCDNFPDAVVTYCFDENSSSSQPMWSQDKSLMEYVQELDVSTGALTPRCGAGRTAAEYLRLLAVCRLLYPSLHIQIDLHATGLKIAQVALTFGADDIVFQKGKPSLPCSEEELRQKIKEAGYNPKRRNVGYGYYWLD